MDIMYTGLEMAHIESLTELDKLCFSVPWSKKLFESELFSNNAYYIVALDKDKVVGYCGINYVCGEGSITNIAVHPEYRKRGIASTLLEKMINFAHKENFEFVTLEVRESNINAIKLYKKYGFEMVGSRKGYYADNHETALLMTKQF